MATPGQLLATIGSIVGTQTGVAIELDGQIANTGTTLAVTPTGLLSDVILDANVTGGTVAAAGGSLIVAGGVLNAVLFQGVLAMNGLDNELLIDNGLTVVAAGGTAGTISMSGTNESVRLGNTPTIDNVTLAVSGENDQITQGDGTILTLGSNFAADITGYGYVAADTIVSNATIDVTAPNSVFGLIANTIINTGTVFVGGGLTTHGAAAASDDGIPKDVFGLGIAAAILQIGVDGDDPFGTYGPAQTLARFFYSDPNNVVFGSGSAMAVGSILQTAQLPGLFADFQTQPGLVILDGLIDNTGATLDFTSTGFLSNVVLEGTVSNGTVLEGGGALSFALSTELTHVTFAGVLDLSANSGATVFLSQSTVIGAAGGPGTIDVNGTQDSLQIAGGVSPQTVDNLLVNLAMTAGATADSLAAIGGTVALGVGVTIDVGGPAEISVATGNGYSTVGGNALLTNAGLISTTASLSLASFGSGAIFVNAGLIEAAAASGTVLSTSGSVVNAGTIAVSGASTFQVFGSFDNAGVIDLATGATLDFFALPEAAGSILLADGAETVRSDVAGLFTATLNGFGGGDVVDLQSVAFAGATTLFTGGVLDVLEGGTLAAALTLPGIAAGAGFVLQAGSDGGTEVTTTAAAPCFLAGTRIRTTTGDVAVEHLAPGMVVVTQSGTRPVVWIGQRRVDCRRHPRPARVQPIRVQEAAFGEGLPVRDLVLSPDHSLFVDGVLIPVQHLLNGATIVRERVAAAHYFHVELSAHDVLYAEGLPAESYLDTGNRAQFANGADQVALHPDFFPRSWADACAPLCQSGPIVAAVRARLLGRAQAQGFRPGPTAMPALLVGDRTIRASAVSGDLYRFLLPAGTSRASIVSSTGVPGDDCRQLGVAIAGIVLDGRALPLDGNALGSGFYPVEDCDGLRRRWTDGQAELDLKPLPTPGVLELRVVGAMTGWRQRAAA